MQTISTILIVLQLFAASGEYKEYMIPVDSAE
jgi:hypothetical protein